MDRRGAGSPVGSILMAVLTVVLATTVLVAGQGILFDLDESRDRVDSLLAGGEGATETTETPTGGNDCPDGADGRSNESAQENTGTLPRDENGSEQGCPPAT